MNISDISIKIEIKKRKKYFFSVNAESNQIWKEPVDEGFDGFVTLKQNE